MRNWQANRTNLVLWTNRLSPEALEALKSFLTEKDERNQRFVELKKKAEEDRVERGKIITINDFEEDWQHSQVCWGLPPSPTH